MKYKIVFSTLLFLVVTNVSAQDMKAFKLYHPEEDAKAALNKAIAQAKKEKKHVLVQIGGNWCVWCARFHDFVTKDATIDSMMKADYVVYHLNWSPENKNKELTTKYRFPERFGFPVFLIIDGDGKLIHTQNSAYLEEGKSYSADKIKEFLLHWNVAAFDPKRYEKL